MSACPLGRFKNTSILQWLGQSQTCWTFGVARSARPLGIPKATEEVSKAPQTSSTSISGVWMSRDGAKTILRNGCLFGGDNEAFQPLRRFGLFLKGKKGAHRVPRLSSPRLALLSVSARFFRRKPRRKARSLEVLLGYRCCEKDVKQKTKEEEGRRRREKEKKKKLHIKKLIQRRTHPA